MNKALAVSLISMATLAMSSFSAVAQDAAKPEYLTKDQAKDVIKEYILENPEVIMESFDRYQKKQAEQRQGKAKDVLVKRKDELTNNPLSPTIGNPKGDVTVVYFFDYNCGYCKKVFPTVSKLIEDDKNVRVVLKEFPILGPSSELAARYALAVHSMDKSKYFAFHSELMKFTGEKNDQSLTEIAKKVGVNDAKLKEEMKKPEIQEYMSKVRALAMDLGIQGTPAFIVGDTIIPGAADYDALKAKVGEARTAKTAPAADKK